MKSYVLCILCLWAGLFMSCKSASHEKPTANVVTKASPRKLSGYGGDDSAYMTEKYATGMRASVDEDGKLKMNTSKRSQLEQKQLSGFSKKFATKSTYKTGDYKKSDWTGLKDFKTKSYQTTKDGSKFQTAFRDSSKSAREAGNLSSESEKSYLTKDFKTKDARESQKANHRFDNNTANEANQKYQLDLLIYDYGSKRPLSVEESRKILGR